MQLRTIGQQRMRSLQSEAVTLLLIALGNMSRSLSLFLFGAGPLFVSYESDLLGMCALPGI